MTLTASQSHGSLQQSRLSDTRKQKLLSLKAREDLKDALTEKFKARYSQTKPGEAVSHEVIDQEVNKFTSNAKVTEANLDRLERRMQHKASKAGRDGAESTVSAYSLGGRSRSTPSLAGQNIVQGDANNFDWAKLDEYAAYLHQQDALRQRLGMQALQKKMRSDLDGQMQERRKKSEEIKQEDTKYHKSAMAELERWKAAERAREEERYNKVMREKKERDEQLEFERQLKAREKQEKAMEETTLVNKIITEMEAEQRRFERKREVAKKSMKKVFEENMQDQQKRDQQKKEEMAQEAKAMAEYNRMLDEQEEARAEEMQARLDRQNKLMKNLQASVGQVQKEAGNEDIQRSAAQMEEMDRHFFQAEQAKQNRLKQLKLENQAYILKQVQEKKGRKKEEKQLQDIQAEILKHDTEEFKQIEKVKQTEKRNMFLEHRKELEQQIRYRQNLSFPTMSQDEMKMNAPLLSLVSSSLSEREQLLSQQGPPVGEEDDE
jgi:hypothetical protein